MHTCICLEVRQFSFFIVKFRKVIKIYNKVITLQYYGNMMIILRTDNSSKLLTESQLIINWMNKLKKEIIRQDFYYQTKVWRSSLFSSTCGSLQINRNIENKIMTKWRSVRQHHTFGYSWNIRLPFFVLKLKINKIEKTFVLKDFELAVFWKLANCLKWIIRRKQFNLFAIIAVTVSIFFLRF